MNENNPPVVRRGDLEVMHLLHLKLEQGRPRKVSCCVDVIAERQAATIPQRNIRVGIYNKGRHPGMIMLATVSHELSGFVRT
jgi:hypothetical protein